MLCQISTKEFRKKMPSRGANSYELWEFCLLVSYPFVFLRYRETPVPASWTAFQLLFAIFYLQTELTRKQKPQPWFCWFCSMCHRLNRNPRWTYSTEYTVDKGTEYTTLETIFILGKVMFLSLAGLICRKTTNCISFKICQAIKKRYQTKTSSNSSSTAIFLWKITGCYFFAIIIWLWRSGILIPNPFFS